MHLFLFIAGIVLFPKVHTLKCYECEGYMTGKCSDTVRECPSENDRCMTSRITQYAGIEKVEIYGKVCAPASRCVEGSVNVGKHRTVFTSKCCTTDLCNDQLLPKPGASRPNGKKCFGCDGLSDCSRNVKCVDNEDHCFSHTVTLSHQNVTIKGCISTSYCLNTGMLELPQSISSTSCCQGDYCNSTGSTGGSLLLLVGTLVSSVIFS